MEWSTRTVDTGGGPFVVHETGDGPASVLYLHDELSSRPGSVATRLAAGARVVAPVHPGFGEAGRPEWVESVRDVAEHYVDLLDMLALPTGTAVVGASMGAWIGTELAIRTGCPFVALSLVSPLGIRVPGYPPKDLWFARNPEELLLAHPEAMPEVPAAERVANEESAARYGWAPRLHDPTLAPRLHRLTAPVQLVWGTHDQLLPKEYLDAWRELLPTPEIAEIPTAGHFPGYERPDRTADAIAEFLARSTVTAERGEQS
ncbi:MAG: alpha/beta hydrolase [Pseudonocardia sp.]|nr:alpha/beta hydrolase [Pseudonocardia sp.]MBO0873025.1 alpha/beta hydrolase [Pseudonocardia sp.]